MILTALLISLLGPVGTCTTGASCQPASIKTTKRPLDGCYTVSSVVYQSDGGTDGGRYSDGGINPVTNGLLEFDYNGQICADGGYVQCVRGAWACLGGGQVDGGGPTSTPDRIVSPNGSNSIVETNSGAITTGDIYFGIGLPASFAGANGSLALRGNATEFQWGSASNSFLISNVAAARMSFQNAGSLGFNGVSGGLAMSSVPPTIASGFGTSPSIVSSSGTVAFTVNVGTGGAASTGVITLPACTTRWVCSCTDATNPNFFEEGAVGTSTTIGIKNYDRVTGLATPWTASDEVDCTCTGQ